MQCFDAPSTLDQNTDVVTRLGRLSPVDILVFVDLCIVILNRFSIWISQWQEACPDHFDSIAERWSKLYC